MLRFVSYDVVFSEVPDEVTLAINLSGCPNRCKGCHSPHLQEDRGIVLDKEVLTELIGPYQQSITCVCFMGGDADPKAVEDLSAYLRTSISNHIKTAWYSGRSQFPESCSTKHFDYVKLGPYIEGLGGLDSPRTNQRFYKIEQESLINWTSRFAKREVLSDF